MESQLRIAFILTELIRLSKCFFDLKLYPTILSMYPT